MGFLQAYRDWRERRKERKQKRREEMKEKYGECRVEDCDEWLLPVGPHSGQCPKHKGTQRR